MTVYWQFGTTSSPILDIIEKLAVVGVFLSAQWKKRNHTRVFTLLQEK